MYEMCVDGGELETDDVAKASMLAKYDAVTKSNDKQLDWGRVSVYFPSTFQIGGA